VIQGRDNTTVSDCADGADATGGAAINGNIIDRLALGRSYHSATPFMVGHGLASTAANKKLSIEVKLQHGASSAGGDMADYSTGLIPAATVFNTSVESSEHSRWTTGAQRVYAPSAAIAYDLRGANRYLREVITPTTPGNTTSTAAADVLNISGGIAFGGADQLPHRAAAAYLENNFLATSTST
ncbi:MAG: hypothetical protein ACE5JH_12820, partial [Acidobacteriota bacterium]